jgi:hypothetical protein
MALYTSGINSVALSTSNDTRTLVTTATGAGSALRLYEVLLSGEAGSSTVTALAVNRPGTNGITLGTTITPVKVDPASANASFSVASHTTGWTTQPVLAATDVLVLGFNAFGGGQKWTAWPGSEIVIGTQGAVANLSFRSRTGAPTVSGHIIVEER